MKRHRLNLLVTKEDYRKYEIIFNRIKIFSLLISIFLFIFAVIVYFNFYQKKVIIENLLKEKNEIIEKTSSKNQDVSKLNALINRYQLLVKNINEDANFVPYYSLLISSLSESTNSAKIKMFKINKQRDIEFTIGFEKFNELMNFFKLIESKKFLDNFEVLSLKNFNLITDSLLIQNYELVFNGRFKPKYENKF